MKRDGALYSIFFMALLAAVFGFITSSINEATRERVEAGERARLQGHVLGALGFEVEVNGDPDNVEKVWNSRVMEGQPRKPGERVFYTGRDEGGAVIGHALFFRGPGFWGPIEGYLGVDANRERLLGISFTSQSETPGLGARITEKWFRDQFEGKAFGELTFVAKGAKGPNELDAITGATETISRLGRFLNEQIKVFEAHPAFSGAEGGR